MIYIILSFPTEDFITPEADDVLLRVSAGLFRMGVKGCFHVVGERARSFRERGRFDIIEALGRHELGYHSNLHSVHPLMSEYLEEMGWGEGVARVLGEEAPGVADLENIFGRRPVYFVHTCAWAPQVILAMRYLGMNAVGMDYVINERPTWYCGNLTVHWQPGMDAEPAPSMEEIPDIDRWFQKRMQLFNGFRKDTGGSSRLYRIFCHLYKFYARESSWDFINFGEGKNTPRSEWRPPALWPVDFKERMIESFERLISCIAGHDDVRFIGYADILRAARAGEVPLVGRAALLELAGAAQKELNYHQAGAAFYSAAEIFGLVIRSLAISRVKGKHPETVMSRPLLGPIADVPGISVPLEISAEDVYRQSVIIDQEMDLTGRVPDKIIINGMAISPAGFLRAACDLLLSRSGPVGLKIYPGDNLPAVARREACFQREELGWRIYKKGFLGRHICQLARLQAWSAKPAVLRWDTITA